MAVKNISDYMPEHEDDTVTLMQARVSTKLYEEFKPLLKAAGHSNKDFMEASMRKYIDEKKAKK